MAAGRRADWPWLLALWTAVTAANLFKPFHIDDAAHLEIARWIAGHPLHPMSGTLNWSGTDAPIHATNQPHLFFYLMAGWGRLFGFGEIAMHALESLSVLAAIVLFHRLARAFTAAPLWATAIMVLGPAFVVGQNVMVDVPLLAAWLAFFNPLLLGGDDRRQTRRFVLAGLACAAALLIKYSSLVLLPVMAASLIVERRRGQAWTLAIPLGTLAAWSGFNILDYGAVHIAGRPAGEALEDRLSIGIAWLIGLGALSPLGLIVAAQAARRWLRAEWPVYAAAIAGAVGLAAAVGLGALSDWHCDMFLWWLFAANAGAICAALYATAVKGPLPWRPEATPKIYLVLWVLGVSGFYILFSPFMAARHVLLVLPPVILLLAGAWGSGLSRAAKAASLAITSALSAGLCLSDWRFAAFYRDEAALLAATLPKTGQTWIDGHWGLQWYGAQAGLPQIDVAATRLKPGDLVIVGREIDHQDLIPTPWLTLVRTDSQTRPELNLICTGRGARFYIYYHDKAPWSLSRACQRHIDVYRVG